MYILRMLWSKLLEFFFNLQGAGSDIPVKEIMDLMQGDPAFDVLFSFFGLGKLQLLYSSLVRKP